jgi:hypothetical protein
VLVRILIAARPSKLAMRLSRAVRRGWLNSGAGYRSCLADDRRWRADLTLVWAPARMGAGWAQPRRFEHVYKASHGI